MIFILYCGKILQIKRKCKGLSLIVYKTKKRLNSVVYVKNPFSCSYSFSFSRIGFTLAEVLITLAIVGVVAALTIPSLIENYQKQEVASKLKKAYSALSNALEIANSEQPINSWNFCAANVAQTDDCAVVANIVPNLNTVKKFRCFSSPYTGANASECMRNEYPNYIYSYDYLHYTPGSYVVLLQDGTIIQFSGVSDPFWKMSIGIDINGVKGPNKMGLDIFKVQLMLDTVTQKYNLKAYYTANCSKPATLNDLWRSRASTSCFNKIMIDGWEIKSDYPWDDLGQYQ